MNRRELRVVPTLPFLNSSTSLDDAEYVIVGFPYDGTSTYRSGSRLAPEAVRKASLNLEPYSIRTRITVDDLKICDLGNLEIAKDAEENLRRLQSVIGEIVGAGKIPLVLGGEHTLTLGVTRALKGSFTVIDFDAHADLRDTFMGARISHATCMRRVCELLGPKKLVQMGTRALCKEEVEYIEREGVKSVTMLDLRRKRSETTRLIDRLSKSGEGIYVTIDVDVLDPAYAPATANPEPDGMDLATLLDMISILPLNRLIGCDLTEVAPGYDNGVTTLVGAKIVMELLCASAKSR